MAEMITSRENSLVRLAAGLVARKRARDESGLFVAEGVRLCGDAAESGVEIETLLVTEEALRRYPEVERLRQSVAKTLLVSEPVADKISATKTSQGVFAVCKKLDIRQRTVTIRSSGHYLLLDRIQDPGNLGAMLRSGDALGIDGVYLNAGCADLYSPKVLRGSMGGVFRVPVQENTELPEMVRGLRAAGVPVYAAALTGKAVSAARVELSKGGAVLIGNEGNGLPEELVEACDGSVVIPMARGANSLNAAVAAGIFMWEMGKGKLKVGD